MNIPGTYTRNWFRNRNMETFRRCVHPVWAGKPCLYLELGIFEAQSLCWMLDNVLTHPDSMAVGIDPWLMTTKIDNDGMEQVMQRAISNIQPWADRCRLLRANSAEILRRMVHGGFLGVSRGTVSLCAVDGNHNSLAVLDDCRLVLQLLRPGGWLMLDDVVNAHRKQDHVRQGLDLFLAEAKEQVTLAWKDGHMECYARA